MARTLLTMFARCLSQDYGPPPRGYPSERGGYGGDRGGNGSGGGGHGRYEDERRGSSLSSNEKLGHLLIKLTFAPHFLLQIMDLQVAATPVARPLLALALALLALLRFR
jgi:hypothetical protein